MKKIKAFTLIELLVSISIIGLLASLILVSVNYARDNAKVAALQEFSTSIYHSMSDVLGIWTFDTSNTGDTTVKDDSGNGLTALVRGSVSFGSGASGKAMNIDTRGAGYTEVLDRGVKSATDPTTAITIEVWIKPRDTSYQAIVYKDNSFYIIYNHGFPGWLFVIPLVEDQEMSI